MSKGIFLLIIHLVLFSDSAWFTVKTNLYLLTLNLCATLTLFIKKKKKVISAPLNLVAVNIYDRQQQKICKYNETYCR